MKIRSGFVSNSSSSSFIVSFPETPDSKEKLAEMMGDCSALGFGTTIPAEEVVKNVWNDIEKKTPNTYNNNSFIQYMEINDIDNDYDFDIYRAILGEDFCENIREKIYRDEDVTFDDIIKSVTENLTKLKEGMGEEKTTYKFTYADEDGSYWSAMEHGDIFRNVPHECISNH